MQLLPHQIIGRDFLVSHPRALLADDMRVGKAVQTVAAADLLESCVGAGLVCIITQATLVTQWRRQFKQFATHQRRPFVFSYEQATTKQRKVIRDQEWDIMALDESHFLKEGSSERTRAVYGKNCHGDGLVASARAVWCLTGTPSPNHAGELWPMLRALFPEVITYDDKPLSFSRFRSKFCKTTNTGFGIKIIGNKNTEELKRRMAPIMLRRPRSILGNTILPPETMYLEAADVLAALEKSLRELLTDERADRIKRAKTPEQMEAVLTGIDDSIRARMMKLVGVAKAPSIVARLKDELESGLDKVVLFCWHTEVAEELERGLSLFGVVSVVGATPISERQRNVDKFQSDPATRVFIGNIKAAGVGLDLSAACELIFAETSWVPGDNDQAAMRITGVNQKRAARVRYAVLPGSLDERLTEVNRRKSADIAALFG